mgnify:CR=1 FL=1
MASQETPNYRLSRWAGTDRILVEEFNDNWDKIDTALGTRNCRFYTASYTGDGEATKTWTFPAKPIMVLIIGKSISAFIQDFPIGITQFGSGSTKITATWHENSVTWSASSNSGIDAANSHDSYGLFAILEA